MPRSSSFLKDQLLDLLDRDREFRYAVAGKLGLSEILGRLDRNEEAIRKLWEEVKSLREGQEKLWEEVKSLREGQEKLWEEVKSLREGQEKLWEGQEKLWEGQEKISRDIRDMKNTLQRVTISMEDEAYEVISHELRARMGVNVEFSHQYVDDREIDIYGTAGDLCVIGEATVRLGAGLVRELDEKVELLGRARPELLRPRVLRVIYTVLATAEAAEEARRRGIWIRRIHEDVTPMPPV
ncbi:MAG: hypothetical protein RXP97_05195 [Nitrososphaeria archaeon]